MFEAMRKGDVMGDRVSHASAYDHDVSWGDADDGFEQDNGMLDPTETDIGPAADADVCDLAGADRLDLLEKAVCRHPLNRELLYKALELCFDPQELGALEREMLSLPEAARATQDPYHLACLLESVGGLRRIELDEKGAEVTYSQKQNLAEEEADDLVASVLFETTDEGRLFVRLHDPRRRFAELVDAEPNRRDSYIELLGFCGESPRSYAEVEAMLRGCGALASDRASGLPVQPSVFVDKLERAGILVWRDGWSLSDEGRGCLAALKDE